MVDAPCELHVSEIPVFWQQSLLLAQLPPEFTHCWHCDPAPFDMHARPAPEQQSDPLVQFWLAVLQFWQVFGPLPVRGGRQSWLPQHCELLAHTCPESMQVWHWPPGVHISPPQQSVWLEQVSSAPEGLWHAWQLLSMQVRFPLSQQSDGALHALPPGLHAAQYPLTQFMPLLHSEVASHASPFWWGLSQAVVPRLQISPPQQSPLLEQPVLPEPMQHAPPAQEPEQHWSPLEQEEAEDRQLPHVPLPRHRKLPEQSLLPLQGPEYPLGWTHSLLMHTRLPQQSVEVVQFPLNLQLPLTPPSEHSSTRSFCPSSVYASPLWL